MTWLSRILLTCSISIAIAFALSLLPNAQPTDGMPVFSSSRTKQLSEQTIVDFVIALNVHERVQKIDWNRSTLSVDLTMNPQADKGLLFRDLYRIAHSALSDTSNVERVLIRVMDRSRHQSGPPQLVIALDAARQDVPRGEKMKDLPEAAGDYEQYVTSRFRVTYTVKWKELFGMMEAASAIDL
jgi:hypothetical protein